MRIIITGGAGFIGSSIALFLKQQNADLDITCFDNLRRRGGELNLILLKNSKIDFVHGDVRLKEDLEQLDAFDLMIECSAEPSVLSGMTGSPTYLVNTNLVGTINCLELCRNKEAKIIFLSTSRVYSIKHLNSLEIRESTTRFVANLNEKIPGFSQFGVAEDFPVTGPRSIYGATKLASEIFIEEFSNAYGTRYIINRCGLIAGPGQYGTSDQGVITYWILSHHWKKPLNYIGFGGKGKQVRDVLHIEDLVKLINLQIKEFFRLESNTFNIGGGAHSISLLELTKICEEIVKSRISPSSIAENRLADIPYYITDNRKIKNHIDWTPNKTVKDTVSDTYNWILDNEKLLKGIYS